MCGRYMRKAWGWFMCGRCQVMEIAEEEPRPRRQQSWIDPDSGEEIPYLDHSKGCWPSPA
jgi:hypothetical protein